MPFRAARALLDLKQGRDPARASGDRIHACQARFQKATLEAGAGAQAHRPDDSPIPVPPAIADLHGLAANKPVDEGARFQRQRPVLHSRPPVATPRRLDIGKPYPVAGAEPERVRIVDPRDVALTC
ncbi:MAG: hypothetical protein VKI81_12790 [Synechococcaceae cyanobacterium]|nr:hypothetical protein [Synechococcaceae cyanobacterium]